MRSRIATLDFARGLAIFGILLLNISAFGLPKAAYLNPGYSGVPSTSDSWTWAVLDTFAQGPRFQRLQRFSAHLRAADCSGATNPRRVNVRKAS